MHAMKIAITRHLILTVRDVDLVLDSTVVPHTAKGVWLWLHDPNFLGAVDVLSALSDGVLRRNG